MTDKILVPVDGSENSEKGLSTLVGWPARSRLQSLSYTS